MKNAHLHFSIMIILFTTMITQAISLNSSYYEACKPQTCGNGPNITYPFWLSNQQEPYCGYPTFKLACKNKNPVISISNFDYIIKHINYSNQSFLLTNSDIDECHLPLHTFTLNNRTPFTQSSRNSDFSFFYNCSSKPSEDFFTYPIICASNSTSHSFAAVHKEVLMSTNMSLVESCGRLVDVPMDYYGAAGGMASMLKMSYVDVLKLGFVLDWSAKDCSDCERSDGRCGFDKNEVVCFCRDRSHGRTCDDGTSYVKLHLFCIYDFI